MDRTIAALTQITQVAQRIESEAQQALDIIAAQGGVDQSPQIAASVIAQQVGSLVLINGELLAAAKADLSA